MDNTHIVNEITRETYSGYIQWENTNPQYYQSIIFNYNFAFKAYKAKYNKKDVTFELLFVEKKFPDQFSDYEGIAESYYPELIILENQIPIGVINEGSASRDNLIRLAGAIESNNKEMNKFRGLF